MPTIESSQPEDVKDNRKLCETCKRIVLKHTRNPWDDEGYDFDHRVFHYDKYSDLKASAAECQLCALVVESYAKSEFRPKPNYTIYRDLECQRLNYKAYTAEPLPHLAFSTDYQSNTMGLQLFAPESKCILSF